MDQFDDFEMKPLTEGLGFHKKAIKYKEQSQDVGKDSFSAEIPSHNPQSEGRSSESTHPRKTIEELMAALDTPPKKDSGVKITETLPRNEEKKAMEVERTPEFPTPQPMPDFIDTPRPTGGLRKWPDATTGVRRGAADTPRGPRQEKAPVSISSAILDSIVVFTLMLTFLISLLLVTGVEFSAILANAKVDQATQISFVTLYVSVLFMYVTISRSFFGKTLGEWTFEYQMGTNEQIRSAIYPLLVVWRSFVVIATGLLVLPLLSFIIRSDLASYLTGLQLYQNKIG